MRLAAPETVLTVLGIQQSTGSLAVAGAALDATFPDLEARIECDLVFGTRTDYFDLASSEVDNPRLRLSSGFVFIAEPITIKYSTDSAPLTSTTGTTFSGGFVVEGVAGVVWPTGTFAPGSRTVAVTYSHGLEVNTDGTFANIPDSLAQAHIALAAEFMMMNPANVAKEKAKFTAQVAVNGYSLKGSRAVQRLHRPRGTVIWPSFTEVASE